MHSIALYTCGCMLPHLGQSGKSCRALDSSKYVLVRVFSSYSRQFCGQVVHLIPLYTCGCMLSLQLLIGQCCTPSRALERFNFAPVCAFCVLFVAVSRSSSAPDSSLHSCICCGYSRAVLDLCRALDDSSEYVLGCVFSSYSWQFCDQVVHSTALLFCLV